MDLKRYIIDQGLKLGFSKIGIASAEFQPEYYSRHLNWLRDGRQAEMDYLARAPRMRFDPKIHIRYCPLLRLCFISKCQ